MPRVLVVKTSSLGDVIHTLPALTDAVRAVPGVVFDWVVEQGFSEVPSWHPAVDRVIPVAVRRWRKHPLQALWSGEWAEFKEQVGRFQYDAVIDAQGLLKRVSALGLISFLLESLWHHVCINTLSMCPRGSMQLKGCVSCFLKRWDIR